MRHGPRPTCWGGRQAMRLLLAVGILAWAGLAQAVEATSPERAQIESWIRALSDEQFFVRRQATRQLVRAGQAALEPVAAAARDADLETAHRCVDILSTLLQSPDQATEEAAYAALEQLADLHVSTVSSLASSVLVNRGAYRQARALSQLQRLGAVVNHYPWYAADGVVVQTPAHVVIQRNWQGGDEGLLLLKHVPDVQRLSLYNPPLTEAAVAALRELPSVQQIDLFGTTISDEGVETLRKALPRTTIDRRKGALLGIHAVDHEQGCLVDSVQDGSAAAKAGLLPQDVVKKFNGEPVVGFAGLTGLIAKLSPGTVVRLEVLRGEQTLNLDATLGGWGDQP